MQIGLVGYGTMGQLVEKEILTNEPNSSISGIVSIGYLESLDQIEKPFDIVIDFSHYTMLEGVLEYCIKNKKPVVLATTGYTDEQKKLIIKASKSIPIVYTANFSLGVTILKKISSDVAKVLKNDFDMEIIEKHHNKKLDSPSGTAKMLLSAIDPEDEFDHVFGREGLKQRGKEIGIHSIRGGSIVGEHSVIFAGTDEVLELKHEAHSKTIFVKGAIKAAKFLINKSNGIYNMDDVLFGE